MSDSLAQKGQQQQMDDKNPTKESDKSKSNSFLRSLKPSSSSPSSSKQHKSSEVELEEGETISPSPSPRHTAIKLPDKPKQAKRETSKEKDRSPTRRSGSRRREDGNKRSTARQEHRSSRYDSDNDSGTKRRLSPDRRRDKSYRSSRYRSRSRSTSRSRTPPTRRSKNRSSDTKPNRSENSRRRSSPTTTTTTNFRSEKSNGNSSSSSSSNSSKYSDSDVYHNNNNSKRRHLSRERRDGSIEKSGTPDKPVSKPQSSHKSSSLSATAPNSETPEQYKLFVIMFSKLAHANKRRGDGQTQELFGMMDHFYALCNYILNFYYVDKSSSDKVSFKQASVAWKSLFPFTDSLLTKLELHQHYDLYGLCARLISLVRYYIYNRMIDSTRTLLAKQLAHDNDGQSSSSSHVCIQVSEGLLREYEKAERWYRTSEKYLSYCTMAKQFPETFKHVCIEGDLTAGITLGGEAGVKVEPMFPFTPYSPLHHAAIVSKCMLNEYVSMKKLDYTPISQPEEYIK